MRWVEIRRHSLTKKGAARGRGSCLSGEGVALARAVGAELGPMVYVVASPSARAVETALAMGFAVDDTVDLPAADPAAPADPAAQPDPWAWPHPYLAYAELIRRGEGIAAVAQAHRAHWTGIAENLAEGTAALVVGHSGTLEPALVACLPGANHQAWGAPFGHCDGARLGFENGRFITVRFRRAPAPPS
jgi:broad specificity phosphatase PhoE